MTTAPVPPEVREFLQPEAVRRNPGDHTAIARAGIDRYSETWRVLVGWLRAEIERNRDALETPGIPEADAALLRGQILACRAVMAIGETDQSRSIDRKTLPHID